MKISVIIPTYKPKEYLKECLDALLTQTLSKNLFEVIIVLNGCKLPFFYQIKEYIEKHINVNWHFIQTDDCGVSNARNIALDAANGEFITFIDDDDWVSPTYLEELLEKADKETISLCYPLTFKDGTTQYEEYYITGDYNRNIYKKNVSYTAARKYFSGPVYKLIHREIIGNRRFDKRFKNGEDAVFMFLISDCFKNVVFTSKDSIYYRRIRVQSASSRKKSVSEIFVNMVRMINAYFCIFLKRPAKYNKSFFFTRILGTVHCTIEQLKI